MVKLRPLPGSLAAFGNINRKMVIHLSIGGIPGESDDKGVPTGYSEEERRWISRTLAISLRVAAISPQRGVAPRQ